MATITIAVLAGCNKHQHTFSSEWTSDESQHWHAANCEHTEEKSELGEHVYDNACDTDCNVCGAERTASAHVYDNACDTDCNVCGAERTASAHVYDNACDTDCNVCGAERTASAHVYDNACDTDCNVCGAERTASAHVYDNACDTDCNVCGAERTASAHVYDNACDTTCNECGATRTVGEHQLEEKQCLKAFICESVDKTKMIFGKMCNCCGFVSNDESNRYAVDKYDYFVTFNVLTSEFKYTGEPIYTGNPMTKGIFNYGSVNNPVKNDIKGSAPSRNKDVFQYKKVGTTEWTTDIPVEIGEYSVRLYNPGNQYYKAFTADANDYKKIKITKDYKIWYIGYTSGYTNPRFQIEGIHNEFVAGKYTIKYNEQTISFDALSVSFGTSTTILEISSETFSALTEDYSMPGDPDIDNATFIILDIVPKGLETSIVYQMSVDSESEVMFYSDDKVTIAKSETKWFVLDLPQSAIEALGGTVACLDGSFDSEKDTAGSTISTVVIKVYDRNMELLENTASTDAFEIENITAGRYYISVENTSDASISGYLSVYTC